MVPIYRGGEPRVTRAGPGQVLLWGAVLGLGRAVGHLEDEGGWSLQRNHLGDSQGKGRAGDKGAQGGSRWSGEPWGASREPGAGKAWIHLLSCSSR